MPASSSKRGAKSKLERATAAAKADDTQRDLKSLFQFTARQSPAPRPASAPPTTAAASVAPLHQPKPRKAKRPLQFDAAQLEIRSCINDVVAAVIKLNRESDAAAELECRNTLNTIINKIELNPPKPKGQFDSLKRKRQSYDNKEEILRIIDEEVAGGATQGNAIKRLRTISGYEHISAGTIGG